MKTLRYWIFLLSISLVFHTAAETNAPPQYRYEVKITDANSQALAGVLVERYKYADGVHTAIGLQIEDRGTTDANGHVTFTATNQVRFVLIASKPGLSYGWANEYMGADEVETAPTIQLTTPMTISGIVQDTTGKPISDAQVWVYAAYRPRKLPGSIQAWAYLSYLEGRKYFTARTTADGRFRIDGLPADATVELAAAKAGWALDLNSLTYSAPKLSIQPGQSNVVLTLKPTGVIEGQVVEEGTGKPIAGAQVRQMEDRSGNQQASSPTGEDGGFRLTDLGAGVYTLHTGWTNQFPDWVGDTVSVTVDTGATIRNVKITASRGAVLEVSVRAKSDNHPLPDAWVSASNPTRDFSNYSSKTSDQGIARLRLMSGEYHLGVSKEGWNSQSMPVTCELGQTNQVTIALEPTTRISGIVVNSEGKPVPQASVSLFPFRRGEKLTDAEGHFTLTLDPNRFGGGFQTPQWVIIARDQSLNLAATQDVDEDSTNATLRLVPGLSLAGRITDTTGKGITNAEIRVMFHTERMGTTFGSPAQTDSSGNFEIKGLPPGRRYTLMVSADGFGSDSRNLDASETNTRRVLLDPIQLPLADQRIAGVVLDDNDQPAASISVSMRGEGQPNLTGRTDAKGQFSFDHVCAGSIQLSAFGSRSRTSGDAVAQGGDTNITIRLNERPTSPMMRASGIRSKLTGTVVDPDGKPAPHVMVSLFPFSPGEKQTDAAGRFTLTSDSGPMANLRMSRRLVIARDLVHDLATALEVDLDATNASLRLEPAWTVVGQVTDPSGKAIANAQAQPTLQLDRMLSSFGAAVRADAEGRFEIKGLPLNQRFSIVVSAKDFGEERVSADAPEGDARKVVLEPIQLVVADQQIAGIVLDANDRPVGGVSITIVGNKQPRTTGRTDSKGRFAFNKVCVGSIRLMANSPAGYGSMMAQGGDTNITIQLRDLSSRRLPATRAPSRQGKSLPNLAPLGLTAKEAPPNHPLLVLLIDAEQRPSRRTLKLLSDQADPLKQKGVSVIVVQLGVMAEDAFSAWKQDVAAPFPIGQAKQNPELARAIWGATALPWLILTGPDHKVRAEGFAFEELDAKLKELGTAN